MTVGVEAWPIDMGSWCDVSKHAQSGCCVRFMGEEDKRVMSATVLSQQDLRHTSAQLISEVNPLWSSRRRVDMF